MYIYIFQMPSTKEDWDSVARDFKELWQFDNCLGAIDGKHIQIIKPVNSGSYYYNYKGTFSIVLMAVVNANYEFMMVHVGTNGRISDGGVLHESTFYQKLANNNLNLPNPTVFNENQYILPYTFVGDQAFPLMLNLMKPYPEKHITREERIFNYRLSRARRVVENAFGILASRFRVFLSPITIDVTNVSAIVLAACALHNYLRRNATNRYIPLSYVDCEDMRNGVVIPGQWRDIGELMPLQQIPRPANITAKEVRETYKNYFNNEGSVPFQNKMALGRN